MNKIFKQPNGTLILIYVSDSSVDYVNDHLLLGNLSVDDVEVHGDFKLPFGDSINMYECSILGTIVKKQYADSEYLKSLQSNACMVVNMHHKKYLAQKLSFASSEDMASWNFKKSLAVKIKSGEPIGDEDKAYLLEAGVTNIYIWSDSILDKFKLYQTALGRADCLRGIHKSAIRLTVSKDELDALMIDVGIGWEELAIQP